jgi:hypothetical protein
VEVTVRNTPPIAEPDTREVDEDTSVTIDVLRNDEDLNGDALTLSDVSAPQHGQATINGANLIYTPTWNFYGTELLTYTVRDPVAQSDVGHVTITVHAVNDAPIIGRRTVLYDGALNPGTPDTQGFAYLPSLGALATQTFSGSVTVLDTTPNISDQAGYFAILPLTLDRQRGYTIRFTAQVLAETHNTEHRAGFSIIVLSQDKRGIELGFWKDMIWAQEGGDKANATLRSETFSEPRDITLRSETFSELKDIFTHAEDTIFDTTQGLVTYELTVLGGMYTLATADGVILSGPLRDYTAFTGTPDPYEYPNFLFLGDDTASAKAKVKLSAVSVITNTALTSHTAEADTQVPIEGLGVMDQDAGDQSVVLTLTVGHGSLTMHDDLSGTLILARPNPLVMHGTVRMINAALALTPGLTYRSHAGFHGLDTLTATVNDLGHTGSGGARQAQRTLPLIVTDTLAPMPPVLRHPEDSAVLQVLTPTLVWRASPDATGYWLDFNGVIHDTGAITTHTTSVLSDGTYTWTVAAYDSVGNTSAYTDTWTFSIAKPQPPVNYVYLPLVLRE